MHTAALPFGLWMAALGLGLGPSTSALTIVVQRAVAPGGLGTATAARATGTALAWPGTLAAVVALLAVLTLRERQTTAGTSV